MSETRPFNISKFAVYESWLAVKANAAAAGVDGITIKEFEITEFRLPQLSFKVVCTTGTYIRSIANDLGEALGCGGYLSSLRRTRIGEFRVDQAFSIEAAEVYIREKLEAFQNG